MLTPFVDVGASVIVLIAVHALGALILYLMRVVHHSYSSDLSLTAHTNRQAGYSIQGLARRCSYFLYTIVPARYVSCRHSLYSLQMNETDQYLVLSGASIFITMFGASFPCENLGIK